MWSEVNVWKSWSLCYITTANIFCSVYVREREREGQGEREIDSSNEQAEPSERVHFNLFACVDRSVVLSVVQSVQQGACMCECDYVHISVSSCVWMRFVMYTVQKTGKWESSSDDDDSSCSIANKQPTKRKACKEEKEKQQKNGIKYTMCRLCIGVSLFISFRWKLTAAERARWDTINRPHHHIDASFTLIHTHTHIHKFSCQANAMSACCCCLCRCCLGIMYDILFYCLFSFPTTLPKQSKNSHTILSRSDILNGFYIHIFVVVVIIFFFLSFFLVYFFLIRWPLFRYNGSC